MNDLIVIPAERDVLQDALAHAELAEGTRSIYRNALQKLDAAGIDWRDAQQLKAYGGQLRPHERTALRSALKHVTDYHLWQMNSQANPMNESAIAAAERRFRAIREAVHTKKVKGVKKHQWLSASELEALIESCNDSARGRRDALAILLMGDCGLRREEAGAVRFADLTFQGGKPVLHIVGKGSRERDVPVHRRTYELIRQVERNYGGEFILKRIDRHGNIFDGITGRALTDIIRERGPAIGRPKLAPHDLRRTFAQIRWRAGLDLEQIRVLLGHESIETTRRYLGELKAESIQREFIFSAA